MALRPCSAVILLIAELPITHAVLTRPTWATDIITSARSALSSPLLSFAATTAARTPVTF